MRLNLAGFCFTDETGISFMYDWILLGSSFVLSALGSYAALELIGRMRLAAGARARYWRAGSAAVLGGSIWSMHFMAILAINIRLAVSYSGSLTALSLVVVTAANGLGLEVCGKKPLTIGRVGAAGTIIGLGIVATHYIAMAAMIFPGSIAYTPGMWGLSILIAIGSAVVELWLSMTAEDALERGLAALIIAILMCGMHFTGMAATVFQAGPLQQLDDGILTAPLAAAVAGTTSLLVVLAGVLVSADRRLPAGRARESSIRENPTPTMAPSKMDVSPLAGDPEKKTLEQLIFNVIKLADTAIAIITADGEFLMTNLAFDRLLDCRPGALAGQLAMSYATPKCRERISQLQDQQMIDRKPYSTDAQFLRADGSVFRMRLTSAVIDDEPLHRFRIVTLNPPTLMPEASTPPRTVVADKIKFISPEEAKAALETGSATTADRIMNAAERILQSGFIEGEAGIRSGDPQFHETRRGRSEEPATLEVITAAATTAIPGDTTSGSHLVDGIIDAPVEAGPLQVTQVVSRPTRFPFRLAECLFEPVLICQRGDIVGHYVGTLPSISGDSTGSLGLPPHKLQARIMAAAEQIIALEDHNSTSGLIFVDLSVENLLKKPILAMYLRSYKNASPAVRHRLSILLSRWPSDIPSNRVRELAGLLRPVCRSVGFRLDEFVMPKLDFGFFDSPFVAVDARRLDFDRRKNGKLERLLLELHSKRARLLVREVPSMTAVRQLRSLGVDFVSMETRAAVADTRPAP